MKHAVLLLACALSLASCRSLFRSDVHVDDGMAAAWFENLKGLEGEWVAGEGSASPGDRATYRVTAAGSAVVETVFAGTDHEMVTVYHLDGGDLMLTHYCAAGNAPSMRALPGSDADHVAFECIGGRNMTEADGHMHTAQWNFIDADHARSTWHFYAGGEPDEAPFVTNLERVE